MDSKFHLNVLLYSLSIRLNTNNLSSSSTGYLVHQQGSKNYRQKKKLPINQ
jgi:hypothetical protein